MTASLVQAVELTVRLRSDFAAVADLLGPERAFYVFAAQLTAPYHEPQVSETEERIVRIVRALYDDYRESHP